MTGKIKCGCGVSLPVELDATAIIVCKCGQPHYVSNGKCGSIASSLEAATIIRRKDKFSSLAESIADSIDDFYLTSGCKKLVDMFEKERQDEARHREIWHQKRSRLKSKHLSALFRDQLVAELEDGSLTYKEANRLLDGVTNEVESYRLAMKQEVWKTYRIRT